MRPEKKFWQEIKKKTPNVNWTRIESWSSPGVPDLFGVFRDNQTNEGYQFWFELKVSKLQKVNINTKQVAWHYKHCKCGGKSFIVVKICNKSALRGRVAIFPGIMSREVKTYGLDLLDRGSGVLLPESWDEKILANTLTLTPLIKS